MRERLLTMGVGKALASVMKGPEKGRPEKRGKHIFRNSHRRRIFSILTMTPCIGAAHLALQSGISQSTAEWHLRSLVEANYLVIHDSGRRRTFYPEGLISREHAGFFEALGRKGDGAAFRHVLSAPGAARVDIASSTCQGKKALAATLKRLEDRGLIIKVMDGVYARYYPTRLLPERAEGFYARSKEFSEFILRRLESEGGKPPLIIKRGLDRILVEAGYSMDRFTLELGINPYMTCENCQI